MFFKDFYFSYRLIIKNQVNKKNYLKALKRIVGYPYKFFIDKIKIFFGINKINLDSKINKKVLNSKSLDELFVHFNSDKGSVVDINKKIIKGHNYSPLYEKHFQKLRDKENLKILEIGSLFGASAASFVKYFKSATVYCLDINPFQIKFYSKKIRKVYIDTQSIENLDQLSNYFDFEFDIILDDGSHNIKDQIMTISKFFPKLKSKGLYIIEDTCEYLRVPSLNEDKLNYGVNEFLESIVKTGDHYSSYLSKNEKIAIKNQINKINFEKGNAIYKGESLTEIIFIEKN